jgi:hypothetical protein
MLIEVRRLILVLSATNTHVGVDEWQYKKVVEKWNAKQLPYYNKYPVADTECYRYADRHGYAP